MAVQAVDGRRPVSGAEALRGFAAFLALAGAVVGLAAALLAFAGPPAAPEAWPAWSEVQEVLTGTELPPDVVGYVAATVGWLALGYLVAVSLLQAVAQALMASGRAGALALTLVGVADAITLPWVKKGIGGGMAAFMFLTIMVKAPVPEVGSPFAAQPAGASQQHQVVMSVAETEVPSFTMTFAHKETAAPSAARPSPDAVASADQPAAAPATAETAAPSGEVETPAPSQAGPEVSSPAPAGPQGAAPAATPGGFVPAGQDGGPQPFQPRVREQTDLRTAPPGPTPFDGGPAGFTR